MEKVKKQEQNPCNRLSVTQTRYNEVKLRERKQKVIHLDQRPNEASAEVITTVYQMFPVLSCPQKF